MLPYTKSKTKLWLWIEIMIFAISTSRIFEYSHNSKLLHEMFQIELRLVSKYIYLFFFPPEGGFTPKCIDGKVFVAYIFYFVEDSLELCASSRNIFNLLFDVISPEPGSRFYVLITGNEIL